MKVVVQAGRAITKGGSLITEGTVLEMSEAEGIRLCVDGTVCKVDEPKPKKKAAKDKPRAAE